jgi:hypothetical protein
MNPFIVASLVGILCILYTFLGGFEGVAIVPNPPLISKAPMTIIINAPPSKITP